MPATVIVNMFTVVHKASNGISMIFPDTCKTPAPPAGPIPIPYPNIAMSTDTADGSSTVKCDGQPIMTKASNFAMSTGDEAGSVGGVVSSKIKGKAYPKLYSFDVKVDGNNVFRLLDIMLQNGGSPTNTPPGTLLQPPGPPPIPMPPPPDEQPPDPPRVTKVEFDPAEACCGDEVETKVETENFPSGQAVGLGLYQGRRMIMYPATLYPKVSGDAGSKKWRTLRGPYKAEVKWHFQVVGLGGPLRSSNDLEVKTAENASEVVTGNRTTPAYVQTNVPGVGTTWAPNGSNYGWEYAYGIEIKDGALIVTRKVNFSGHSASGKQKRRWKREIEEIWDRKFKLHRDNCKRGNDCNCSLANGCCVWAVRILCEWGAGHGANAVTLNEGANQAGDWGGPNWWYSHNWWEEHTGVPATVRPHEFGHLMGMYDEYPAGACDPGRLFTDVPESVMNSRRTVFVRHVQEFCDWFNSKAQSVVGPVSAHRL